MCTFCTSFYIHFSISQRTAQIKILFALACVMFALATAHFVITFYRTVHAIVDVRTREREVGSTAFLGDASAGHLIAADVLYVTQCILGDSVAIYRCWILWDRDARVVLPPLILLVGNIVSGYAACQKLATGAPGVLGPGAGPWILAFYVLAVAQNTLTTGLTAVRLWWVDRTLDKAHLASEKDATSTSRLPRLQTTILLLVESAALYGALQVLVLAAFVARSNVQFILLGSITPIVAVTFTLITIRVGVRAHQRGAGDLTTLSSVGATLDSNSMCCAGLDLDASPKVRERASLDIMDADNLTLQGDVAKSVHGRNDSGRLA
ncbi:hypothetical protein C8R43DRAFT_1034033 [Mycena crocata]|nr:hypothetical protein C8R43DRAFT_1034033 [Mycena crocata]